MCSCCGKDVMECECFFCDLCGACTAHTGCSCYEPDEAGEDSDEDDDNEEETIDWTQVEL